jgi:hypothetical protein
MVYSIHRVKLQLHYLVDMQIEWNKNKSRKISGWHESYCTLGSQAASLSQCSEILSTDAFRVCGWRVMNPPIQLYVDMYFARC